VGASEDAFILLKPVTPTAAEGSDLRSKALASKGSTFSEESTQMLPGMIPEVGAVVW
jgi:hypothetical protein